MPAVSVILPAYNAEAFLGRSIASILNQTYADWELIIVDDGSTDGSADIAAAAAAADSRIKLLRRPNGGVSAARNIGIAAATAPYIAFIDADDEYYPEALALMMERGDAGADMVCANMQPGKVYRHKKPVNPAWTTVDGHTAAMATLYQQPPWHTGPWSKLYRRSLFDNLTFTSGMRYEDLEIVPLLLEKCRKVDFTAAPLYFYRTNPASFMQKWSDSRLDALKVTEKLVAHYRSLADTGYGAAMTAAAESRHFSALCNIAGLAYGAGRRDVATRCLTQIRRLSPHMLALPRVRLRNKAAARLAALPDSLLLWLLRLAAR